MIKVNSKGDFSKLTRYFVNLKKAIKPKDLERFGQQGVAALQSTTPQDTGLTARSWSYNIETKNGVAIISFNNSNIQNGVPIAIILQYGHGTRNGGWVEGRDYINPALRPIFDKLANDAWREVTNL